MSAGSRSAQSDPASPIEPQQTSGGTSAAQSTGQPAPAAQEFPSRRKFLDCLHRAGQEAPAGERKPNQAESVATAQGPDLAGLLSAWLAQAASTPGTTSAIEMPAADKAATENVAVGKVIAGVGTDAGDTTPIAKAPGDGGQGLADPATGGSRKKGPAEGGVLGAGLLAIAQTQLPQAGLPTGDELADAMAEGRPRIAAAPQVGGDTTAPAALNAFSAGARPQIAGAGISAGKGKSAEAPARLPQATSEEGQPAAGTVQNAGAEDLQTAANVAQVLANSTDTAQNVPGHSAKPQAFGGRAGEALLATAEAGASQIAAGQDGQTHADSGDGQASAQRGLRGLSLQGNIAGQRQAANPSETFEAMTSSDGRAQGGEGVVPGARPVEGDKTSQQTGLQAFGLAESQAAIAPAPANHAAPAAAADSAAQGPRQVLDQIAQAVRSGGAREGQQVVIHLNPPELGNVRMTFHSDADGVRCSVQVDSAHTFQQIQHEAPALAGRLAEGGVHFKGLEITMRETGNSASSGSTLQDGQAGRNPTQNQNPWQQSGLPWQESRGEQAPQAAAEAAPPWAARPGDGAVNVWR